MIKRSHIADSLRWAGVLTLALCIFASEVLAASDSAPTVTQSAGKKPISALTKVPVSNVTNLELLYANGGVRVRVHTGARIEFSHQIEPPKNGRPYRIILDCLNSYHKLGAYQFRSLPASVIQRIRTSQFAVKPQAITRIVLDLSKEAFYRVEQQADYIDLFITDRKAKRFNSWSSASWLAARNAGAAKKSANQKKTRPIITVAEKTPVSPAKAGAHMETETPVAKATVLQKAKTAAPVTIGSKGLLASSGKKAQATEKSAKSAARSEASAAKIVSHTVTPPETVSAKKTSGKKTALAKVKNETQPPVVVASPIMKNMKKSSAGEPAKAAGEKPVLAKTTVSKNAASAKARAEKPVHAQKAPTAAVKPSLKKAAKTAEKKPAFAGATVSTKPASSKAPERKSVSAKKPPTVAMNGVTPVAGTEKRQSKAVQKVQETAVNKKTAQATSKRSGKSSVAGTSGAEGPVIAKVEPKKESARKTSAPKASAKKAKKSATQKTVTSALASAKQAVVKPSAKMTKKVKTQPVKADKKSPTLAVAKSAPKSPTQARKPKSAEKNAGRANSKAAQLATKKESAAPQKKAAKKATKKTAEKSSSSLFATTANAATPASRPKKDSESERRYKAQFRRSIDQRKIKLKGAQVAEFPKRLTIKYKTHGTRDPFATLLDDSPRSDDMMMTELPNVEALTMVGILRDVKGHTRGLFEDIDGRGYILSRGDKVRNGTVLKVTRQKAYFQIFEYGWSRTVALSLEG